MSEYQIKPWTEEEWEEAKKLREQGATYREIGQMFGRTSGSVYMRFYESRKEEKARKAAAFAKAINSKPQSEPPKTIREKTLHDFSPREIIKHLYELGYRIEDGKLVVIEKKVVNLQSVLSE